MLQLTLTPSINDTQRETFESAIRIANKLKIKIYLKDNGYCNVVLPKSKIQTIIGDDNRRCLSVVPI